MIDADPVPTGGGERLTIDLREAGGRPATGRVLIATTSPRDLRHGDPVAFSARLESVAEQEEPGWRDYLIRRGIAATGVTGAVRRDDGAPGNRWWWHLVEFRDRLGQSLDRTLPPPENSLARGMTLGDRAVADRPLIEALRRSGLAHIIVVSGYNVVVVMGAVWLVLGAIVGRRPVVWLLPPVMLGYALLTGFEPPVVRASLMIGLGAFGWWLGRPVHWPTILGFSAAVAGLIDPRVLGDLSFLLSFAATAALAFVIGGDAPDDSIATAPWPVRLAHAAGRIALASVAASLATAPLLLATFGRISLIGPLTNVLVTPLIPLATLGSAVVAVLGLGRDETIPNLVAWPTWAALWAIVRIAEGAATLPAAELQIDGWQPEWIWPVYGALAIIAWARRRV